MKQLTLDLRADAPPVLENFVAAANADLLAALYEAVPVADVPQHIFLWGDAGSGRSHLLRSIVTAAAQAGRPACYLQAADVGETLPEAPGLLLAIDDVEALGPDAQIALFRAFNGARGQHFEVEITRERVERLGLAEGQAVRLLPSHLSLFESRQAATTAGAAR